MKKVVLASLIAAAFPAVALAGSCDDYYKKAEEDLKKDGNYSEQAMKIIKDQVAAVPADQQETFCKTALEAFGATDKADSNDKDDAEEKEDAAKG
ncbi:cell surface protein [Cardiobacterium sp. Marseille-Q4385]|uniref:cell surface protein n=1 Tax=Cardiobacterium sp. Marseille-Q4385 TaxID=2866573 RepID=UPI001CE48A71|nr:cell surface protein [Cardiobacterium sp. Marseille-Q4385]